MSISKKIKAINNKIDQNKPQYDLDKQGAKILALSPRKVSKHKVLTVKDVLSEKNFQEKSAKFKRFEYCPLGRELKAQTGVAKKQY